MLSALISYVPGTLSQILSGGGEVRTSDPLSRETGFESSCCRFETWAISFTPRCSSSVVDM